MRVRPPRFAVIVPGVATALVLAWMVGAAQSTDSDFFTFWTAGGRFMSGRALYEVPAGSAPYLYPPFAAMLFQALAFFPLQIAASMAWLVNLGAIATAVGLTREIVTRLRGGIRPSWLLTGLAILASARFLVSNQNQLQVNLIVVCLCLLGVRPFLDRREAGAAAALTIAAGIKLTPLLFVVWAFVRGSNRLRWMLCAGLACCVLLPAACRGPKQGLADLEDYGRLIGRSLQEEGIGARRGNVNLAGLVYRSAGLADESPPARALVPMSPGTARRVTAGLWLVVASIWLFVILGAAWRSQPVEAHEICLTFVTGHLLSGISWRAHLVSMVFVYHVVFSSWSESRGLSSTLARLTVPVILFVGIVGRDVVGGHLAAAFRASGLVSILLVLLFVATAVRPRHAEER